MHAARHPLKMDPSRAGRLLGAGALLALLTPTSALACGNAMSATAVYTIIAVVAAAAIIPTLVAALIVWVLPARLLERRGLGAQIATIVGISITLTMLPGAGFAALIHDAKGLLLGLGYGLAMAPLLGPWLGAVIDRARIDQAAPTLRRAAQISMGVYLLGCGAWLGVVPEEAATAAGAFGVASIGLGVHSLLALVSLRLWRRRHTTRY